jgi:hypothetical protein
MAAEERQRRGARNRERAKQFTYAKPAEELERIYRDQLERE